MVTVFAGICIGIIILFLAAAWIAGMVAILTALFAVPAFFWKILTKNP